jgi:hypothetical protein
MAAAATVDVVTFYGGAAGLVTLGVPFARTETRLRLMVVYPCGCRGQDVYQRIGDIAVCAFHEPAPMHRVQFVDGMPPLDGDEWKDPHLPHEDGS